MVKLEGIYKEFKYKKVLRNVNLEIKTGECIGIIGANGSGKSTLISIIVGALKPTSGNRIIDGRIGYVPQDNALIEELSVKDNIEYWAAVNKKTLNDVFQIPYLEEVLSIKEMMSERVCNLSGGMKKRVSIGISLINDPEYIILDEPCSALDIVYKTEVVKYLDKLKKLNKSIIYTSHNGDEIEKLCDRIYILKNGEFIKESTVMGLKREYPEDTHFDDIVHGYLV